MNIKGKLVEKFDEQQITNTFKKREFVIEYAENPQYPEFVKFELIQDKCDLIETVQPGQEIDVHFNLKGRKWTDPKGEVKYFNSLQAWRVERTQDIASSGSSAPAPSNDDALNSQTEPEWLQSDGNDDDLPF